MYQCKIFLSIVPFHETQVLYKAMSQLLEQKVALYPAKDKTWFKRSRILFVGPSEK